MKFEDRLKLIQQEIRKELEQQGVKVPDWYGK